MKQKEFIEYMIKEVDKFSGEMDDYDEMDFEEWYDQWDAFMTD